jgi:hypothetical protein
MAATIKINEYHGPTGTPVKTDKASGTVRFKNADNATVDLVNPMVVPTAGVDISYEKILRLEATGTFTQISNLAAYTDGANGLGTGVSVLYKLEGSYGTPTQPGGTTGFSDIFALTVGTPADMDAINTGPFTATGDIGDFLTMILTVGTNASNGLISPGETLTFSWDEI